MSDERGCSEPQLERFIQERLSQQEQTALERHLDTCTACRERLETIAADRQLWAEAREHLHLDDGEGECAGSADHVTSPWIDEFGILPLPSEKPPLDFLAPTDRPSMLGRIGLYEISGIIGQGGTGVVLKGFDSALNRYVAIKVLSRQMAASAAARRRFARESQAAAAVTHENVVPIFAVSEFRGLPYLVMPYIPGESLQRRIDRTGPLELKEILRIAMQTAAGLAAAHAQGLVHRDVKPANILLSNGTERVMITDFGLARAVDDASLTRSGVIAGTPQYMSPEQARGESVDHRSDLFSLGSVVYAMCVGRPPFRAESTLAVLRRISESTPRPIRELVPEVPEWLAEIVAKLQAKQREDRFHTASEVADLLQQWLAHLQQPDVIPRPQRLFRQSSRRVKRWRRACTAACILMLSSVGVLALTEATGITHVTGLAFNADPTTSNDRHVGVGSHDPLDSTQVPDMWWEELQRLERTASEMERNWTASGTSAVFDPWERERRIITDELKQIEETIGMNTQPSTSVPD